MDILTRLDACAECEQAPLSTLLADAADEIRMLRKDAERYRWLRENAGDWEVSCDYGEWTKRVTWRGRARLDERYWCGT